MLNSLARHQFGGVQHLLACINIDSEMPLYGIPYNGTSGALRHVEDGAESGSDNGAHSG